MVLRPDGGLSHLVHVAGSIANRFRTTYAASKLAGCSSHSGRRTFITRSARLLARTGGSLRDIEAFAQVLEPDIVQRDIGRRAVREYPRDLSEDLAQMVEGLQTGGVTREDDGIEAQFGRKLLDRAPGPLEFGGKRLHQIVRTRLSHGTAPARWQRCRRA